MGACVWLAPSCNDCARKKVKSKKFADLKFFFFLGMHIASSCCRSDSWVLEKAFWPKSQTKIGLFSSASMQVGLRIWLFSAFHLSTRYSRAFFTSALRSICTFSWAAASIARIFWPESGDRSLDEEERNEKKGEIKDDEIEEGALLKINGHFNKKIARWTGFRCRTKQRAKQMNCRHNDARLFPLFSLWILVRRILVGRVVVAAF